MDITAPSTESTSSRADFTIPPAAAPLTPSRRRPWKRPRPPSARVQIFTELFTILGDGFYKPMIELFFNSLVQPTMVCTLEVFSGIKALSRPLFDAVMPLAECGATFLKGCQCVRVTFDRSGDGKGRKFEELTVV